MRLSSARGFTLLEIMMVFVLIGILGAIGIPRLNTTRFKADAAMHVVQGVLQQAQRAAIQRQTNVIVSFDVVKNRVRSHYDANNNNTIDTGEDIRWASLSDGSRFKEPFIGLRGTTPSTSVVGSNLSTSADGYPTIIYRRDGAGSTSAEVYLTSSATTKDDFRCLIVTQATGRVDLYQYGNGKWRKAR